MGRIISFCKSTTPKMGERVYSGKLILGGNFASQILFLLRVGGGGGGWGLDDWFWNLGYIGICMYGGRGWSHIYVTFVWTYVCCLSIMKEAGSFRKNAEKAEIRKNKESYLVERRDY